MRSHTVPHVAHAAQNLHAGVGAELQGLGGVVLQHADFTDPIGPGVARVGARGHLLQPGRCGSDALLHVDELVAHHLVADQWAAKGLTLLRPGQRLVVAGLGVADGTRRQAQALAVEVAHDGLETLPFFAQQVARRHPHAIETQVRGYLASDAELWAAERDGRPAGFMGLDGDEIVSLFVDPSVHRGRVGRALMTHAQARGATWLGVNEQNPGAVAFYERLGFVVTDRAERDSAGRPFPILTMRRS